MKTKLSLLDKIAGGIVGTKNAVASGYNKVVGNRFKSATERLEERKAEREKFEKTIQYSVDKEVDDLLTETASRYNLNIDKYPEDEDVINELKTEFEDVVRNQKLAEFDAEQLKKESKNNIKAILKDFRNEHSGSLRIRMADEVMSNLWDQQANARH